MFSYHRVGVLLFVVGFTIKGLYALGVLNSLGRSSGYLPNFAILFLFSKSSFWYGFYLKNENEKFLFYLKYKENMCGSWFAVHTTHPSPHQPTQRRNLTYQCFCTKNKKVDHSNKKLSLLLPKEQNKTKHNSIFSKCKKVNQLMHFIFTKSTK